MIIFTDNQKVYDLSYLRSNTKIFKTKKFPIALDKFIYSNIKKIERLFLKIKKMHVYFTLHLLEKILGQILYQY